MGNNNLMITEMFEEIKSLLVSIEKKLDTEASKSSRANPDIEQRQQNTQPKVDLQNLEQIFKAIYAYLQNSDYKTSETNQRIGDSEKQILSRLQEIKYSIETQEKERIVRHQHSVDLKSSKVVYSFFLLLTLLLISLTTNVHLLDSNYRLRDTDIKYRFIKSQHGINDEKLRNLEKVFQAPRNNRVIKAIRAEIERYENS